jgi:hypothetical protein
MTTSMSKPTQVVAQQAGLSVSVPLTSTADRIKILEMAIELQKLKAVSKG